MSALEGTREQGVATESGNREWELRLDLVLSSASACLWSCAFISFIRWFPKRLKIEFVVSMSAESDSELPLSLALSYAYVGQLK